MFKPHVCSSSTLRPSHFCLLKKNNNTHIAKCSTIKRKYTTTTECDLAAKKCVPCEGGVNPLPKTEAMNLIQKLHQDWRIVEDGKKRAWKMRNFVAGINFFEKIKDIAEDEGHHPDLHLVNYRDVTVDLWTHAIGISCKDFLLTVTGGLSENDFIIAAKIDQLKPELKK